MMPIDSANTRRLQGCINDLVSLLALPAMWTGSDASQVLGMLLDVLLRMLCLDFAYARLNGPANTEPFEICRVANQRNAAPEPEKIGRALEPWLNLDGSGSTSVLPDPVGNGGITVARAWLGLDRERGVVVAASTRAGFPGEIESLLLRTAVNQAIIEIQRAEVLAERTRTVAVERMKNQLLAENTYLRQELEREEQSREIVGHSKALQDVLLLVSQVAPTKACVLIQGETGTGKELIARAIHRLSTRNQQPFVKLNCAAIPTGLLESELFGHDKGAFTGAIAQRIGRFELAHRGTIFLDEVGEIPLELQAKLLRVLQEQDFERLGGARTIHVDARLIAASNRNLAQMVAEGKFRSDLYYRLNVFPISVPPLRDRVEDIPQLVRYFTERHARQYNKSITRIAEATMTALRRYPWPGNVREMANLIERGVILSPGPALEIPLAELKPSDAPQTGERSLLDFEREHILRVLNQSGWVIAGPSGAAAKLGMKRTSLQYKMQKLGINRPR
jgi:formate hydrogenlyase transcriptional activator